MRQRALALVVLAALLVTTAAPVFAQRPADVTDLQLTFGEWLRAALASELQPDANVGHTATSGSEPETRPPKKAKASLPPEAIVVRKGPRSSGAVALTFDDGFDLEACASIADTLRANGAVGTFFINGIWIDAQPARWRAALEGMEFANHTRSHRNLADAPRGKITRQIDENEQIEERALGRPMSKVLRPPYGAQDRLVRQVAKELGYDVIALWSRDTQDWSASATVRSIVKRATGAPAGSIILMHCGPDATAKAMPKIVRYYQRQGIELAGLSTVLKGAKGTVSGGKVESYGGE